MASQLTQSSVSDRNQQLQFLQLDQSKSETEIEIEIQIQIQIRSSELTVSDFHSNEHISGGDHPKRKVSKECLFILLFCRLR